MENSTTTLCVQGLQGSLRWAGFSCPKSVLEQQMEVLETVGLPAISLTGPRMTGLGWVWVTDQAGLGG